MGDTAPIPSSTAVDDLELLSCDELKSKGNDYFVKNDFVNAEKLYTIAIDKFEDNRAILYTNRSAARLGQNNLIGALEDSECAIEADKTWTKAYYRRATALEKLNRHRGCFNTWKQAAVNCENTPWLTKQIKSAAEVWVKKFKVVAIESVEDLLERYKILGTTRQRLSTMAHLWNESTEEERFNHFKFLLTVIGGEGELSEVNRRLTASHMQSMPLHNYVDLPREQIASWCDFYRLQPAETKTHIMHSIWEVLESTERDAVIADLKLFIARAYEFENLISQSTVEGVSGGEEEGGRNSASDI